MPRLGYATMRSMPVHFGLYEFDSERTELRREGVLVHLQSQPMRALAFLIEHAGQAVTREDLCRAIWGGDTHVDFERGLNFCISQVRTALRDDAAKPIYIRTLPKQGYSFIAPIQTSPVETGLAPSRPARPKLLYIAAAILLLATIAFFAGYRFRTAHAASPTIVAVLRFDNETDNPDLTRFSDNLTDTVVERLTTQAGGQYSVIGNAAILRLPREERDLIAIASSLHAKYVVLGQVQAHGSETRVLAHLIRLPEQTHLWVDRVDLSIADPLASEREIAARIAGDFAPRIAADVKSGFSSRGLSH